MLYLKMFPGGSRVQIRCLWLTGILSYNWLILHLPATIVGNAHVW